MKSAINKTIFAVWAFEERLYSPVVRVLSIILNFFGEYRRLVIDCNKYFLMLKNKSFFR